MAQQYFYYGETQWHASSGDAIFCLYNKPGSGKKLSVRSVEIYNYTSIGHGTIDVQTPFPQRLSVYRTTAANVGTSGGGYYNLPERFDTTDPEWPSLVDVAVERGFNPASGGTQMIGTMGFVKNLSGGALLHSIVNYGKFGQCCRSVTSGTLFSAGLGAGQGLILHEDEALAVAPQTAQASLPVRVNAILRVSDNMYVFDDFVNFSGADGEALFVVRNPTGSGVVVELVDLRISEAGTYDTPYFQLVPVGSVDPGVFTDSLRRLPINKMDTSTVDLATNIAELLACAPLLPFGVPQNYIAEGSAGSPKGFNYLQTKDFIGPIYASFFPEAAHNKRTGSSTTLIPTTFGTGFSRSMSRVKGYGTGSEIVIRPSEGLAMVSGAETATAATAVGLSGWVNVEFMITFTVENETTPELVLTNLVDNSEVRILEAGTANELGGIENTSGGTFSYPYEFSPGAAVDVVVHHLNYEYIRLTNIALTTTGASIPIQQRADRQYQNP